MQLRPGIYFTPRNNDIMGFYRGPLFLRFAYDGYSTGRVKGVALQYTSRFCATVAGICGALAWFPFSRGLRLAVYGDTWKRRLT
jgi:hypothetical protein